jgi:hypothetical protein
VQPLCLDKKFIDEYRPQIMALSTMPRIYSAVGLAAYDSRLRHSRPAG